MKRISQYELSKKIIDLELAFEKRVREDRARTRKKCAALMKRFREQDKKPKTKG